MRRKPESTKYGLVAAAPDHQMPYAEIAFRGKVYRFSDVNRMTRKRIDTFLAKEPTTMAWIETFSKADVYWDVGGNIGVYVVYAAVTAGCEVVAFEPEALNYAELNKNIRLNDLGDRVRAYCCGVSDRCGLFDLYLSRFVPGFSHHDCAENRFLGPVTGLVRDAASRPRQGCLTTTLDAVLAEGRCAGPTHVKIDVDGLEGAVIAGARALLRTEKLETVLVETDFGVPESVDVMALLTREGWRYSMDQVCMTRDEGKIAPAEWKKRLADRTGGCNIIYYRDAKYDEIFAKATY
jgi:FkbM family methyltransferase